NYNYNNGFINNIYYKLKNKNKLDKFLLFKISDNSLKKTGYVNNLIFERYSNNKHFFVKVLNKNVLEKILKKSENDRYLKLYFFLKIRRFFKNYSFRRFSLFNYNNLSYNKKNKIFFKKTIKKKNSFYKK